MSASHRHAFSLIEILIVTGILSLLLAIGLPALFAAREHAKGTICLSNLRSLGHAVSLYGADYDGAYPFGLAPVERDQRALFYDEPYLTISEYMDDLRTVLQGYVNSTALYRCPSEHNLPGEVLTSSFFERYGSSYSYNAYPAILGANESYFPRPSTDYLMADIEFWHGGTNSDDGRMNELFADYHVKSVLYQQYEDSVITPQ